MDNSSQRSDESVFERSVRVRTDDGALLTGHLVEPRAAPRGTLIVSGAMGVPHTFYRRFALAAAQHGLRAVTYDYRGFGASSDSPGPRATATRWAQQDYPAVLRWVLDRHAATPVYVVGHSLGGQILALPEQADRIQAAVIIASMSGAVRNLERDRRRVELMFRYVVPAVSRVWGQAPGWLGLGETLPGAVAQEWARWCLHPEYYLGEHPEYRERLARFQAPLTMLSFADDPIAPLVNVRWLVDLYVGARPLHRHLTRAQLGQRVGHLGFFRGANQVFWPALFAQLEDHRGDFMLGSASRPVSLDAEVLQDLNYGVV